MLIQTQNTNGEIYRDCAGHCFSWMGNVFKFSNDLLGEIYKDMFTLESLVLF